MFKQFFAMLKSVFGLVANTVDDATKVAEDVSSVALMHSDLWVKEAYAETSKRTEELAVSDEEVQAKLKQLRNRNRK